MKDKDNGTEFVNSIMSSCMSSYTDYLPDIKLVKLYGLWFSFVLGQFFFFLPLQHSI